MPKLKLAIGDVWWQGAVTMPEITAIFFVSVKPY
jgi:hypothetical protein